MRQRKLSLLFLFSKVMCDILMYWLFIDRTYLIYLNVKFKVLTSANL